ncbi:AAA domain-containing protein [Flavobacterium sp.]|uniref:AAA domain-containing protein n=1 Tax=Flavobacterium sp. TaxID=239 RepID=UPI0039E29831
MELTEKLLSELQRRLKIGNRRGVHLNAIPANSRYKFDLNRLSHIDKNLPNNFITALLSELPLKFRISWKDNVPDLNSLFEEEQVQLVKITKAFENLINQTDAIESEKGINTFGFGFPVLARRDKTDNKLTVAPILIWSLKIKRTKEFNTWEILRNEDDPIYINEVLINHLQNDSGVDIEKIPSEMLDDGLISKEEVIEICSNLIRNINTSPPADLEQTFKQKLDNIVSIGDKNHYEKLPLNSTNSFIEFGGLFSIFEVQKQNIINDYANLMELEGMKINLEDLEGHHFQPISSIETDPSQQSILHSLESTRNVLIQGPPGTGKSQTLTAVLVNALENNKKTIVVCEKRTALEVLHNALIEKGLNYHCVLIRDIVKDRKTVVDSVRDRVDNSEYKRYRYNFSKETLGNLIDKAKNLISTINVKHQKLDKRLIGDKTWTHIVGDLLAEVKNNVDDNNLNIEKDRFNYSLPELNNYLIIIENGQKLFSDYLPIESKSFINPTKLIGDNLYLIEQTVNEDFDFYSKQIILIKSDLETTKKEFFNNRKSEIKKQIALINDCFDKIFEKEHELTSLLSNAKKDYCNFRNTEFADQLKMIESILYDIEEIFNNNPNNQDLTNVEKVNSFTFKLLSIFSGTKKQTISNQIALQDNFKKIENLIVESKDFAALSLNGDLTTQKSNLAAFKNEIETIKSNFAEIIENEFTLFGLDCILTTDNSKILFHSLQSAINNDKNSATFKKQLLSIDDSFKDYLSEINFLFQNLAKNLIDSKDIQLNYSFDKSFQENRMILSEIKSTIASIDDGFETKLHKEFESIDLLKENVIDAKILPQLQKKVSQLTEKIKSDNWVMNKPKLKDLNSFILDVESLMKNKNDYFDANEDLFAIEFKWFQFYNGLSEPDKKLIHELRTKNNWKKSFMVFYLNSLLINSANLDLPTSDQEHTELEDALTGLEKEQLKFIKEFWFSKQIDETRNFEHINGGLTVENLYNKRSSNRFKRLSLRQIVQKDADLFCTFFPIVLTTPDVASNLFKGMNGYFDIVMFDEASQLRLEDNLPAILKGKQIVIAGDEHQMPPSNYFSKVFDGTIEDEDDLEEDDEIVVDKDNILLSCESLLDFASELNFQKKHLDFHYRSRHPFLIDFSNYAFYNQRLKPLPNNFDYTPIKYIQVNGTFSDHTNEAEAEMVLSIIENNINRLPNGEYPTVGIATFNIAQRDLINRKIFERQKFSKFEQFNMKIQELIENGMFIKNLENIQGDERDVIILSTTYGKGKDGKFAQRFGPINHTKGYKLLNVIITRAKYKIYICTSVPEENFMDYKGHLITEGSNNKRAVLYAYLAYCKSVSEANEEGRISVLTALAENTTKSTSFNSLAGGDLESPFEEEVYQRLMDHFEIDHLIPQMKFAEFRIDIVYDPKIIGAPKIAIECDGAKYHSSREAYLYDRHRQKMLENHGFVFHRIWSTNWWRNPNRETTKLVDFINQMKSTIKNFADHSETSTAFTDDIIPIENYVYQNSAAVIDRDKEVLQAIEPIAQSQIKITTEEVKLNSKVKVKYMNNNRDIDVQLVETENNKPDNSGVQKIYYKSALATSLLGHSVGDIVKIGNLDNFVEIIKITNSIHKNPE